MRIAVLALLGGCSFHAPDAVPVDDARAIDTIDGSIIEDARFRKPITITSGTDTPLVDFAVSIVLAGDADLAAHARDDGADLAFVTAANARLDAEIVGFDGTSGALEAWVRLPAITSTAEIAIVYGGEPVTASPSPWSAQVFAGAWHLGGTTATFADSAAGHAVVAAGADTMAVAGDGIIGGARVYDGTNDTATAGDPSDGSLDFGMASFSVSAWVNVTQSANAFDMVIDKGGDTGVPGYCFTLGTSNWFVELSDGPVVPAARFGAEVDLLGNWHQLTAVIDRTAGQLRAFTDGRPAQAVSIANLGSLDATTGFGIGSANPLFVFRGRVDEVRVYKQALALDWIETEVRNVARRETFVAVGPEEAL